MRRSVYRSVIVPAPKTSIIHGEGIGGIFDKVDYRWVYGDTADYIIKMMNVGRRATDYPDNKGNIWTGGNWFEFPNRIEGEFGNVGDTFVSGRKNKINFIIKNIFISELRAKGDYLNIVFSIKIELTDR